MCLSRRLRPLYAILFTGVLALGFAQRLAADGDFGFAVLGRSNESFWIDEDPDPAQIVFTDMENGTVQLEGRLERRICYPVVDEPGRCVPMPLGWSSYYLYDSIVDNSAGFIARVSFDQLNSDESKAGLMVRASLFGRAGHSGVVVNGRREILWEKSGAASRKMYTVPATANEIYMKAAMDHGAIKFYVAKPREEGEEEFWIPVGSTCHLPKVHYYGMFFHTKNSETSKDIVVFDDLILRESEKVHGLAKTVGCKCPSGYVQCPNDPKYCCSAITGGSKKPADCSSGGGGGGVTNPQTDGVTGNGGGSSNSTSPLTRTMIRLAPPSGGSGGGVGGGVGGGIWTIDPTEPRIPLTVRNPGLIQRLRQESLKYWYAHDLAEHQWEAYISALALPEGFWDVPLPLLENIRNDHASFNAFQQGLMTDLEELVALGHVKVEGSEEQKIEKAAYNVEVYLADAILSFMDGRPRKYRAGDMRLYGEFQLADRVEELVDAIKTCEEAEPDVWDFLFPGPDLVINLSDCLGKVLPVASNYLSEYLDGLSDKDLIDLPTNHYSEVLSAKDNIIQTSAPYILNLAMLGFIDQEFYATYFFAVNNFVNRVKEYTKLIAPLYEHNNIPMKVMSAIMLYELPHERFDAASTLLQWTEDKFTQGGGYAEGTAYLEWLNTEMLPAYYISVYNNWLPANLQHQGVRNGGNWLLAIADESGYIPAMDDAVADAQTVPPGRWIAPYAFLNQDNRFLEYTQTHQVDPAGNLIFTLTRGEPRHAPMRFLTYPPAANFPGLLAVDHVSVTEGIAKINYQVGDADISVDIITEPGITDARATQGFMLDMGGSHDQQDHGSIALRRQVANNRLDHLIIDPGYGGYSDKANDEYYDFHNTIRLDTHTHGGVDPCPLMTREEAIDLVDATLDVDVVAAAKTVATALIALLLPLPELTELSDDVSLPMPGIRGDNGGGSSEIVHEYTDGFEALITYDTETNGVHDHALRTVLHFDEDVIVIDRAHAGSMDFSVHYNLPDGSTVNGNSALGQSRNTDGSLGLSQVHLTGFCSDNLATTITPGSYDHRDRDATVDVERVVFANEGTNLPANSDFLTFLTITEPRPAGATYANTYTDVAGNTGDAAVCVSAAVSPDVIRYIFVNTINNGTAGTVVIPAVFGHHDVFTTDAEYGIVEFDRNNRTTTHRRRIYNASFAMLNQAPVVLPKKVAGDDGTGTTYDYGCDAPVVERLQIGYCGGISPVINPFLCRTVRRVHNREFSLLTPTYMSDNFVMTVKVANVSWQSQTQIGWMRAGLAVRKTLSTESDYTYFVGTDGTPNVHVYEGSACGPEKAVSIEAAPPNLWLRIERDDGVLISSWSSDGTTYQTLDHSMIDGVGLYVGPATFNLATEEGAFAEFQDLWVSKPVTFTVEPLAYPKIPTPLINPFGGFIPFSANQYWSRNSFKGSIYSTTPGGTDAPAEVRFSDFSFDRNSGGVSLEWRVRFPVAFPGENFSDNNRLSVRISDPTGEHAYSLLFTPTVEQDLGGGDLTLMRHSDTVVISQVSTNSVTPLGHTDSAWVRFRVEFDPAPYAGGDGGIRVFYDANDGRGFVKELAVVDTTYTQFANVTFNYVTGTAADNYTVELDDIALEPLVHLASYKENRAPEEKISPVLEKVISNCDGTYQAVFGYNNKNPYSVIVPVGSSNKFHHNGQNGLDLGQPRVFRPGRVRADFTVEFDGGNLVWNLMGRTSTASGSAAKNSCDPALVGPVLEGVFDNCDGTYTAWYGYNNNSVTEVRVPVGEDNRFAYDGENDLDLGQSTVFQPGRAVGAFTVNFDGSELVWNLGGRTATASGSAADTCAADLVRPVLEGVVNNCDGTYTAYFGYDNRNASTVVLPHGSENRFNYQGAELVDMGQPETFESGRMIGAFSVEFDGSALVWKLGGATTTAEAGSATGDACGQ